LKWKSAWSFQSDMYDNHVSPFQLLLLIFSLWWKFKVYHSKYRRDLRTSCLQIPLYKYCNHDQCLSYIIQINKLFILFCPSLLTYCNNMQNIRCAIYWPHVFFLSDNSVYHISYSHFLSTGLVTNNIKKCPKHPWLLYLRKLYVYHIWEGWQIWDTSRNA